MRQSTNKEEMSTMEKVIRLQQELEHYLPSLSNAVDQILDMNISSYPIFVAHKQHVEIGIPLMKYSEIRGNWSINVSTLEELVTKQVIAQSKVEDFKEVYKKPEDFITFFVLSEIGAQFIWLPRK